jgi:Ricin-type beta-trefoil lectin domain-like
MIVNRNSGMALDLIGGNTGNGTRINQWSYDDNGPNQRWGLAPTESSNHFRIVSWASGKCACIDQDSTAPGAQLHAWDYNVSNAGDQKVRISPRTNGRFKFYFVHDNMSWDIPGGQTGNFVLLQQYPDNGNAWQEFWLERAR